MYPAPSHPPSSSGRPGADLTDRDGGVDAIDSDNRRAHVGRGDLTDDSWQATARCRDLAGTLTALFFSDDLHDIARAKAICARCPVSGICLDAALARAEPVGVWGGQLLANGEIVLRKRPRGRPPKHPRPELVVDEVPLPDGWEPVRAFA